MLEERSRSYNSIRNISVGFGCQIVTMLLGFATRTLFVRLLGKEYTGVSGLFSNILSLLSMAELGIGNVLVFCLYKPIKEKDELTIAQYVHFYRRIYLGIALCVFFFGLIIVPLLPCIISDTTLSMHEIRVYYLLYLLNSVLSYFAIDKATLIQADQKLFIKNIVNTTVSIFTHIALIAYLLMVRDYTGYIVILVLFTFIQNIVLDVIAKKIYPFLSQKVESPSLDFKKKVFSSVKSVFIYKISGVIINYTDNILISMMFGIAVVGFYSNYATLLGYVITFIGFITSGIAGSLGNLNAGGDYSKSYTIFRRLLYAFSIITAFCIACYASIVQGFVSIWIGEEYLLDGATVFAILFSFYIDYAITPIWMFRESFGMFKEIKYILLITAALNIVLSVLLGEWIGLSGILIATGLSRLLTVVWYEPKLLFAKFNVPVRNYFILQLKYLLLNLVIIILALGINSFLPNSFFYLIIKVIICSIITFTLEFITMKKTDEYEWLEMLIKRTLLSFRGLYL